MNKSASRDKKIVPQGYSPRETKPIQSLIAIRLRKSAANSYQKISFSLIKPVR